MASLAQTFCEHLDLGQRDAFGLVEDLSAHLSAVLAEAHAAWPEVAITDETYLRYVAQRAPEVADPAAPYAGLHLADLYLACGCVNGEPRALAAFESTFRPDLAAVARRFPKLPGDDLCQVVLEKILVAVPPSRAKLADYSGLGFLQNWVRITATRTFLDFARKHDSANVLSDQDALLELVDPRDDVELAYLKEHYRAAFKDAFGEAIGALTSRDRNALRQHVVAGLTIDQLAAIYGVHRATAARRVANARQALLDATKSALGTKLRIDPEELGSIMQLIHSQLDLSIARLLVSREG